MIARDVPSDLIRKAVKKFPPISKFQRFFFWMAATNADEANFNIENSLDQPAQEMDESQYFYLMCSYRERLLRDKEVAELQNGKFDYTTHYHKLFTALANYGMYFPGGSQETINKEEFYKDMSTIMAVLEAVEKAMAKRQSK